MECPAVPVGSHADIMSPTGDCPGTCILAMFCKGRLYMEPRSLQEIDSNFANSAAVPKDSIFYDVLTSPFHIDGFYDPYSIKKFCRLPPEFLPACNQGVQELAWHTAGGRVRFATDSPWIAVAVQLRRVVHMSHMPCTGHSGIDLYGGPAGTNVGEQEFCHTFFPPDPLLPNGAQYNGIYHFLENRSIMREITLHLPLYNGLEKLYVGVQAGAVIQAPIRYRLEKPVLFYGSSITQGGCASRPGNSYINYLSRWLNFNYICLGFSGSAKGEQNMAQYIASLDLSAVIMDYDHNAYDTNGPDGTNLAATHYPFYQILRQKHPDMPILMISKPDYDSNPVSGRVRRDIILKSYLRGRENGDNQLWFIDGQSLFQARDRGSCTVDGTHPNDLGFYRMAETIYPYLKEALRSTIDHG